MLQVFVEFPENLGLGSNQCKKSCKYCGLRSVNTKVERYALTEDEAVECAKLAHKLGIDDDVVSDIGMPLAAFQKMTFIILAETSDAKCHTVI